jgi:DNA-directed RNA polymerase subunit RPC12/RpoP
MNRAPPHCYKCPDCGSKRFIRAPTYDPEVEYDYGRVVKRRQSTDVYPIWFECCDSGRSWSTQDHLE